MSIEENKTIVRRCIEDGWNKRNLAVFDELVDADVVHHGNKTRGLEAFKKTISAEMTAFPDCHMTIDDMIAERNKVVVRYTFHGTHKGEIEGIPPTGNQVIHTGIFICRCENGKVVDEWENMDELGYLQQLGVIPPLDENEG